MNPAGRAPNYSIEEFDHLFESVKNWGRWGPADEFGTLNLITPSRVAEAATLVRSGRTVSMSLPVNTAAGPDNPHPAVYYMAQGFDVGAESGGPQFATDFIGMEFHGDCHTHIDALCHIAYRGRTYGGRPSSVVTTRGATVLDIARYAHGIVGRGVLIDVPRFRGVPWLEPGEAVDRQEFEAVEAAQGVRLREGDVLVFRTGHHRRRLELGPWDNGYGGGGKAGLHVDVIPLLHERGVAAFLPDGDGEAVPSTVDGVDYPIHALQIAAMGMACADSLNLEDISAACAEQGRSEFLVTVAPLRISGATGSPFNPLAVL